MKVNYKTRRRERKLCVLSLTVCAGLVFLQSISKLSSSKPAAQSGRKVDKKYLPYPNSPLLEDALNDIMASKLKRKEADLLCPCAEETSPAEASSVYFYLVTVEELETQLPSIVECGWDIYGAMSYERWMHHPSRTLDKSRASIIVFPPFLTDELNWPFYSGGSWEHNYARSGNNPGSQGDKAGECSIAFENFIRTQYKFQSHQRYLLHFGSCGWDRGYALPPEAYQDERAIIAKGNALYPRHRRGIDISLPPPFTDDLMRMRLTPSSSKVKRSILLAFKGKLDNHDIRREIQRSIHDPDKGIIIIGNEDKSFDYWELLSKTLFALVVRGHVSFSYRFSEVVCSGAIPVLLADDWVPPFDDIVPFKEYGVRVREANVHSLVEILSQVDSAKREELSHRAVSFCQEFLISPWHQFDGLMNIALSRISRPGEERSNFTELDLRNPRFTKRSSGVILISWLPTHLSSPGLRALANNREKYAKNHGYEFLKFDEDSLPTQDLRRDWASLRHLLKPRLVLHVLENTGGWVIWMDADTLITNFSISWVNKLKGDVVFAEAPDVISNNGVFAVRAGQVGKHFVSEWIRQGERLKESHDTAYSDNAGFILALLHFAGAHVNINSEHCEELPYADYDKLSDCYHEVISAWSVSSGSLLSVGPNKESGAFWADHPHFHGDWGINSGLNFRPPNNWREGDFILHLAGQGASDREVNAWHLAELYG